MSEAAADDGGAERGAADDGGAERGAADDGEAERGAADDGEAERGAADPGDRTLGGYLEVHTRPPAFSGSDGQPYTTSVEIESVDDLASPYVAYLVFPRWAETGLGIVGHVETPLLYRGKSRAQVEERIHALPLSEVKRLLDEAIEERGAGVESKPPDEGGWRSS